MIVRYMAELVGGLIIMLVMMKIGKSLGIDFIADEAADIAETVVNAVMVDRLKAALPLLSDSEQELIQAIFFDGLSEREVGARFGITQSVVNKRKARILRKLRKIIEN